MKPAADVISRNVGDEVVLLDLRRGVYFGLNELGARVWMLMTNGDEPAAIAAALAAEYDAEPERIEADVRGLLLELRDEGLVVE